MVWRMPVTGYNLNPKFFIMKYRCLAIFYILPLFMQAQQVKVISSTSGASLRGLSVVDNLTVWVSGSAGTVGRSEDGGLSWKWMTIRGFEKTDFRDIEAFDKMTALVMGIGEPAYILKTVDGGERWKVVFENKTKGMFLDAMEFWNEQSGIVIGDPIQNKFYIARTFDGGSTWQGIPDQNLPVADSGEACFASSGTNIRKITNKEAVFISGGLSSCIYIRGTKTRLPILQGKESWGANSIAVNHKNKMIVVGGDFTTKDSMTKNCFITDDGGKTFTAPVIGPHGYRSCVEYIGRSAWVSCGLNGIDYSADDGLNWKWISTESFHVCQKAKNGRAVFFAGNGGRIGKLLR